MIRRKLELFQLPGVVQPSQLRCCRCWCWRRCHCFCCLACGGGGGGISKWSRRRGDADDMYQQVRGAGGDTATSSVPAQPFNAAMMHLGVLWLDLWKAVAHIATAAAGAAGAGVGCVIVAAAACMASVECSQGVLQVPNVTEHKGGGGRQEECHQHRRGLRESG